MKPGTSRSSVTLLVLLLSCVLLLGTGFPRRGPLALLVQQVEVLFEKVDELMALDEDQQQQIVELGKALCVVLRAQPQTGGVPEQIDILGCKKCDDPAGCVDEPPPDPGEGPGGPGGPGASGA